MEVWYMVAHLESLKGYIGQVYEGKVKRGRTCGNVSVEGVGVKRDGILSATGTASKVIGKEEGTQAGCNDADIGTIYWGREMFSRRQHFLCEQGVTTENSPAALRDTTLSN